MEQILFDFFESAANANPNPKVLVSPHKLDRWELCVDKPVVIVDYDLRWPTLYEEEKGLICKTLGHRIRAIEHIGSTAVPNLGGKNIIDIMAGVDNIDEADECLLLLGSAGYGDVSKVPPPDDAEWFYCLGKSLHIVGCHLHLVKYNSEHWKKHIIFRDFLRKNPETAHAYFNLKKRLAAKYETDRLRYTEAKTTFIESIIENTKHSCLGVDSYRINYILRPI